MNQLYILHVEGGSQVGPMTLAQVDSWMDSHPFERTVMKRAGPVCRIRTVAGEFIAAAPTEGRWYCAMHIDDEYIREGINDGYRGEELVWWNGAWFVGEHGDDVGLPRCDHLQEQA